MAAAAARPVAVVIGVGPGLGRSVSVRFAKEGYAVALVSRDIKKLTPVKEEIEKAGGQALSVTADASVEGQVKAAFKEIREKLGHPEVLVFNAGAFKRGPVAELTAADFENVWRVGCLGGFLTAHEVLPSMYERKKGTIIFTGATASIRGGAGFSAFAASKFALRALAQSLAKESGPKGVHVAHVLVDGQINETASAKTDPNRAPGSALAPDSIANLYWQLHTQDSTVWTFEQDIRPSVEKW